MYGQVVDKHKSCWYGILVFGLLLLDYNETNEEEKRKKHLIFYFLSRTWHRVKLKLQHLSETRRISINDRLKSRCAQ